MSPQARPQCLYRAGPPVTGEDFYDRVDLVDEVLTNLRDCELRSFLLLGTRRIGKTSILKELQFRTKSGDAGDPFICLEWNMQGKKTPEETRIALLPRFQIRKLEREYPKIPWAELRDRDCLVELMDDICREAQAHYGRRVLLTIDEPEPLELCARNVEEGKATDEERRWVENIRDMINHVEPLSCVVAAPPTTAELFSCELNPLEECVPLQLRPLPHEEALRLIYLEQRRGRHGLERKAFSTFLGGDEGVALILAASGRIPYLLQSICRELLIEGNGVEDPIQSIKKLCRAAVFEQTFSSYFKEFSALQKLIMLTLASRGQLWSEGLLTDEEVEEHLQNVIATKDVGIELQLSQLERLQVVVGKEINENQRRYRIAFSLFGQWMRTSFADRWQEAIIEARTDSEVLPHSNAATPSVSEPLTYQESEHIDELIAELKRTFEAGAITEEFYFKRLEKYSARRYMVGCGEGEAESRAN